ncbi:hypothetical protein AX16_009839 [Volvariella volvacea WC 439]|nr:hypothetical protein AX16_009839 [Volvariella volvacea WC 439]
MVNVLQFPEELILHIFEFAAEDRPTCLALLRVCKAAHRVALPCLYRWLTFYEGHRDKPQIRHLRRLARSLPGPDQPPNFLGRLVKSICITNSSSHDVATIKAIITQCTSLVHFATFDQPNPPHHGLELLEGKTTLKSLAGDLSPLFPFPQTVLTHSVFQNLTHLAVADLWQRWTSWDWTALDPAAPLSHIALAYTPFIYSPDPGDSWTSDKLVQTTIHVILNRVQNLVVCVLAVDYVVIWQHTRSYKDELDDVSVRQMAGGDPRLVGLACDNPYLDWNPGWNGTVRRNFWDYAERKMRIQALYYD